MEKILVVEDDHKTNEAIAEYLESLNYCVTSVYNGEEVCKILADENYGLIILDIMLPGITGIALLSKIREFSNVPILMLTAINDESMQVLSFDGDADDYMTKPFSMIVLGRRVRALLKRSKNNQTEKRNMIRLKNTVVDLDGYKIWVQGELCEATPKEIGLIKYFSQHKGIVLSRQRIIDCIWGNDAEILDRTIDTYIKNIRRKFGIDCISTVKGIGYRMDEIEDDRN